MLTHERGDDQVQSEPVKKRGRTGDVTPPVSVGGRMGLHPLTVLRLQQSAGNAAVARLVAGSRAAKAADRRTESDHAEEHDSGGTKPQPPEAADTVEKPEPPTEGSSPEDVPGGRQPRAATAVTPSSAATEVSHHSSPNGRGPGPSPAARAAATAPKMPVRPGAHTVAALKPLKIAPARPPSAPVTPALPPAAAVPSAQPTVSVDTAAASPGAEVGDEAEAPVRPGESDEELAHLDQQAEPGASGGAAPNAPESAPQPEPVGSEPEPVSSEPDVAADVTAEAGPESAAAGEHPASVSLSTAGGSVPSSGGDLEALEVTGPTGPDSEVAEAQQEEQFRAQDAHAAEGEAEADRGLAEASAQEAAETAAESPSQGATAEAAGEATGVGDVSRPVPTAADPSQVQAEAGATVEAAGEDMSGEAAADAAGGAGGGGGTGGGGEGGESAPDTAPPAPPNLSGADPAHALATAAALPPAQLAGSLETVSAGASRAVAEQRAALAANPPEVQRGAGAAGITPAPAPPSGIQAVPKAADRSPVALREPRPLPAAPPAPVERARTPQIAETSDGKVSPDAARNVQAAVRNLPTSDPALTVTPGAPPRLPLAGDADPQQVHEQQMHVDQTTSQAAAQGQRDAAAPMGEDHIYPTVPATTLRAAVPAASGGATPAPAAAASAVGAAADSEAVSVVAQQEKGDDIRAAVTQGAAQITGAKADHARQSAEERQRSTQEIAGLEQSHTQQQAAERAQTNADVQAHRQQWTAEQAALVASHRAEASTVAGTARQSVIQEQTQAEQEAAAHHQAGEQEAAQARREGEQEAARARQEGEKESSGGGFFGWVASAMKSLVDKVKNGIKAAFDKARAAVRAAIQKAQQLATAVIERARQAVVAAIRVAGAALIAIGDRLLAAFPAVRDRFRKAIQDRVKAAEAAVNRLAEGLERGVKSALDLLGKGLDAALGLLEKGMLAAVDAVKNVVQGALDFARKAIEMLGAFAAIAKDIAKGPGRWLSMLKTAIVSGIRDHLWGALKTAVKEWFNSKVEEITGFGQAIWNLLKKGGISLAQVGKMVWQGVVAAIPGALFAILVEKLVSMIVPAAGAVLAIIQGIQAAWGAIQRIIQAISAFVAFLKGVIGGSGPVLFAQAVAAAAVAVIEFVAQWLLKKLKGAATGVGGKLREIAKRIGQRLKAIGKAVAGGAKRAAGAAMRAVRAVGRGIARGARAVGRGIARGARFIERKLGRFGAAMGRGIRGAAAAMKRQWQNLKAKFREWRDKLKQKWENWKKKKEERKAQKTKKAQEKLDRAVAAIRPPLHRLLTKGVSTIRLKTQLLYWKIRHRLSSLTLGGGTHPKITARVNPSADVDEALRLVGHELQRILDDVGLQIMEDARVRGEIQRIKAAQAKRVGRVQPRQPRDADAGGQPKKSAKRPEAQPPRQAESPAAESAVIYHENLRRLEGTTEDIAMIPENSELRGGSTVVREEQIVPDVRRDQVLSDLHAGREEGIRPGLPGNIQVHGVGGRGSYDEVAEALTALRDAGMSNEEIRDEMFRMMGRNQPQHPALLRSKARRKQLAAVTRLVAVVEPGRHPRAHATTFMGWSMIRNKDGIAPEDALTGFNPMSPKGATAAAAFSREPERLERMSREARERDEGLRTTEMTGRDKDVNAHIEREKRVTAAYLKTLLQANPTLFIDTGECTSSALSPPRCPGGGVGSLGLRGGSFACRPPLRQGCRSKLR